MYGVTMVLMVVTPTFNNHIREAYGPYGCVQSSKLNLGFHYAEPPGAPNTPLPGIHLSTNTVC